MNVPALRPTRLPMPEGVDNLSKWRVLVEAIFPNAQSVESVLLALDYCKERNLDVLKKPVNIVPMWNSKLGRYVETIWPSINEIQVTAARTEQWAGMDAPTWGPLVSRKFSGRKKDRGGWIDISVEVNYPEWCAVTVYRTIAGMRCGFTEPVYWLEAYGRVGGGELPNDMWCKRPRGQLHKVAKAASLRAAFPEESEHSAEEMEGAVIDAPAPPAAPAPPDNWKPPDTIPPEATGEPLEESTDPETGEVGPRLLPRGDEEEAREWCQRFLTEVRTAKTSEDVDKWEAANAEISDLIKTDAPKLHVQLKAAIGRHRVELAQKQEKPPDDQQGNTATASATGEVD